MLQRRFGSLRGARRRLEERAEELAGCRGFARSVRWGKCLETEAGTLLRLNLSAGIDVDADHGRPAVADCAGSLGSVASPSPFIGRL